MKTYGESQIMRNLSCFPFLEKTCACVLTLFIALVVFAEAYYPTSGIVTDVVLHPWPANTHSTDVARSLVEEITTSTRISRQGEEAAVVLSPQESRTTVNGKPVLLPCEIAHPEVDAQLVVIYIDIVNITQFTPVLSTVFSALRSYNRPKCDFLVEQGQVSKTVENNVTRSHYFIQQDDAIFIQTYLFVFMLPLVAAAGGPDRGVGLLLP